MKNTLLGRARPLAVRSVGLGCMGMVSAYPPIPDKKDMIRFTREAVDQGATFLDTAEVYGPAKRFSDRPWRGSGTRWSSPRNLALPSKTASLLGWTAARPPSAKL